MRERVRCEAFFNAGCACHLCGGHIVYEHYGRWTATGWQVDHDVPRVKGGSDAPKNLKAAHSKCNARKGARSSDEVRSELTLDRLVGDIKRADRQLRRVEAQVRSERRTMVTVAGLGVLAGAALAGDQPIRGAFVGGAVGILLASALR